ncbi:MAG TPA: hypothetical protein VGE76_18490, partial [Opitutaceae bacterium]
SGRELYIPWRLSEGAVLYRDVDDFYGPLSQYFNAGVFKVFGPGMIVLAWVNIALFCAMAGLLYGLVRKAWGGLAALLGVGLFIAVFGFSRLTSTGGFNYALPYSHETTHGLLVLLVLVGCAQRWLAAPAWRWSGAAGLMLGLALVLKAEIILAAVVVCGVAAVLRGLARRPLPGSSLGAFAAGAALPSLAFFAYFCAHVSPWEAFTAAGRAWFNVLGTGQYVSEQAQLNYSGLDAAGPNLARHLLSVLSAVGLFAVLAVLVAQMKRLPEKARGLAAGLFVVLAACGSLLAGETWTNAGPCLLGLQLIYVGWLIFRLTREGTVASAQDVTLSVRALLVALGVTLMARMLLNGRIPQFGFYQAAIGAVVVLAALVAELPECVRLTLPGQRRTLRAVLVALLAGGIFSSARHGQFAYTLLQTPYGEGRDRFYSWDYQANLQEIVRLLNANPGGKLIVLPEGLMLNYLARRASPVAPFFFYSVTTAGGREAKLVEQLKADPPEWVVVLPRDLREYGIQHYGERPGAGAELLDWVRQGYFDALTGAAPVIVPENVHLFRRRQP